tara:strand:+ start:461 stop:637 length:177 start_codon:yes stop_codon:yes gene_type:complete
MITYYTTWNGYDIVDPWEEIPSLARLKHKTAYLDPDAIALTTVRLPTLTKPLNFGETK